MDGKVDPRFWAFVIVASAIIGCLGAIIASVISVLPNLLAEETALFPVTEVVLQSTVSTTPFIQPTSTVQSYPTDTLVRAETTPTTPFVQPTPTSQLHLVNTLIRSEMDTLLGEGNWFCFPDRETGVAVKRVLPSFVVQSPLKLVVTYEGNYSVGEVVPQLGATIELDEPLLQNECPFGQLQALAKWTSDRLADNQPFNLERIDSLLGTGNWQCLSEFAYAVSVFELQSDLTIQYPITFVSYYDSTNHGVGEIVPKGQPATIWLGGSISKNQCPN